MISMLMMEKRKWSTTSDGAGGDHRIRSRSLLLFGFVVCMALVLVASPSSAQTPTRLAPDEVSALRQIAKTLGKTDWNFEVDPCSGESGWATPNLQEGFENYVTCTCPETVTGYCHINSIVLKRQGLQGTLPKELTRLPFIREFDVSCNYLNGTIPKEWGTLQIARVSLFGNRLSGPIPKELGDVVTLENLSLEGNNFSGEIPPHIGNLTNLREIILSSNKFTGELPHALGRLTNIIDFRISDNLFSGKLPDFIVKWTRLQRLHIQGTPLAGPIPSGISELEHLSQLRISDIAGTNVEFPNLIRMKNLTQLILRNCLLSGQIPEYIGQLTSLRLLDLSFNNLTGGLPDSLKFLKRLQFMYFTNNSLTGLLPDWILGTSMEVDLSYNNFTGMASGASVSCPQGRANVIHPCLRKSCDDRKPKYSSFHINCGSSKSVTIGNRTFDGDDGVNGGATFFVSSQGNWALSSTGTIMDNNDDTDVYTVSNSSILSMPNPELYMVARISPLSLKYYGLCLWNGPYTVKLYFAEIEITDDKNYSSLGNRIFDVYIQGKLELTDFNIKKIANGSGRTTVQTFHVNVATNILEIHFFWAGKGTERIPRAGVYGPLISAISVESDFQPPGEGHSKKIIILTVICVAFLLLMFLIIGIIWKSHVLCWRPAEMELQRLNLQTAIFTLRQIKGATNNFSAGNKIGEGGFGPVYKGYLSDGTIVAVKQLSSKSKQGSREFITEIGMISALQHPNLVKLYGCCTEGKQLLLVYEYMENNSLAQALFGPEANKLKLDWSTRHKICIGIARGLAYLHEESALKIVHRDIKCTNVLLDKDLNAKISDFGLAKLDENENTHISTHIAGTFGYMAPEYAMRGHLSFKSDVYSFGVVALEIASGKSNTKYKHSEEDVYLLDWARLLQDKGTLLVLVDQDLGSNHSKEQALTMLNVALLCTNPSPSLRPTMSTVVSMLEGQTPVQSPLPSNELSSAELHKKTRGILAPQSSIQSQACSKEPWSASSISDLEEEEESGYFLAERSLEIRSCNEENATTYCSNDESTA